MKKYTQTAVDLVIFSIVEGDLSVALIQMKKSPFKDKWAFPGGLVPYDESLDQSAKRELKEKAGMRNVYLEQLYTFGDVKRDPYHRVISVVYFALINSHGIKLKTTDKYKDIRWFPITRLPSLAYDHDKIANFAINRLKNKLEYTNVVYSLLPDTFTLSELQNIYEIILGKQLDKRNFRKKIESLKILTKTRMYKKDGAHRPALLYKFKEKKMKMVEIL